MNEQSETVAILLATHNGAKYLSEQLESLRDQTHARIDIWASDDGSSDATRDLLREWAQAWTKGRVEVLEGPGEGFSENFRSLLRNEAIEADYFAFCDQDDIWEPRKLEKALDWMRVHDSRRPLLFGSRTLTMSEDGTPTGLSPLFARTPSFRNALVQSLAGGNTMVINRAARDRIAVCAQTDFVTHDWWSYLVVSGVGGEVRYDPEPLVRYRQHGGNQIGANNSWWARLVRVRRLFEGQFQRWTDQNLAGLGLNRHRLGADAIIACDLFAELRRGPFWRRLRYLRASGVYRQTLLGNLGLYFAVCIGRM